jgi:CRP/FNR family cyclic AMP-dependent transcriptional regulator
LENVRTHHPCSFASRLSAEERDDLYSLGRREELQAGSYVFQVGDAANTVYFLETGRVKIYHHNPSGKEVLLWFCLPGDMFGLSEMRQESVRQVCAETCEPSRILILTRAEFEQFIRRHRDVGLLVIDVLSSRLRGLGSVIEALVANDVHQRVAQLLLRLVTSYGQRDKDAIRIEMRVTHQEMASMIGTSRQSLTSALNRFKEMGMVVVRRNSIAVLDEALLQELAGGTAQTLTTHGLTENA